MGQVIRNLKDILLYSDSYLFELFVGLLHAFILPLAILEIGWLYHIQIGGLAIGLFQLYAVGRKDLKCRVWACQGAFLLALMSVIHYIEEGMLHGSHLGWGLVLVMALLNLVRTFKEKLIRG